MNALGFIPNLLTLGNLSLGVIAICMLFHHPKMVVYCLIFAAILDFLDGFSARLLKVESKIGKQLDSLADMVSFGLLPALIALQLYALLIGESTGLLSDAQGLAETTIFDFDNLGVFPILMLAPAAAFRLAKFNVSENQSTDFKGLATPANAIFWMGVYASFAFEESSANYLLGISGLEYLFPLIAVLFSLLMISNVTMFSLKFKNFRFSDNIWKYLMLTLTPVLLVFLGWFALSIVVVLYIFLSMIKNMIYEVQS